MTSTKLIKLNLVEKLKNKAYRSAFFRARAQDDTAANIRSLREKRDLSQTELAKLSGMKQSAISRIEQAEYSSWTYRTLQRVADALDARLMVIFEPAEDVVKRYENMENFQSLTASANISNRPKESEEFHEVITTDEHGSVIFVNDLPNALTDLSSFEISGSTAGSQVEDEHVFQ